jgi:hypothetical protein
LGEVSLFRFDGQILGGGISPTYGAPEQARDLVLLKRGKEVLRVHVALSPGELTVVDL